MLTLTTCFFFVSSVSKDLNVQKTTALNLTTASWKFGFGNSSGYGYKLGGTVAIFPYASSGILWSNLLLKNSLSPHSSTQQADKQKLDYLGSSFRLGRMMGSGVLLQIFPMITFRADYERQVIFPRLSFWKFAGSYTVEIIGEEMLDSFVKEIVRSSPYSGPIVNFILKNGFAYAMYELRKEKMHWPFNSAEPLMYNSYKAGMTFTF